MNSFRKTAIIVGSFFLIAMVGSLIGGGLLESILEDHDYLTTISAKKSMAFIGVLLEFINGVAIIGIAIMLFPVLRRYNENITFGYFSFRIIEAVFCIVSAIIPLTLITLSREYIQAESPDTSSYQTLGNLFMSARIYLVSLLIPVFFSLGALLFYYLLYRSKLIPRFISVWGFIGVVLVLSLILLEISTVVNLVLTLPIILNEIFLGIWLIVKGFDSSVVASVSVKKL